MLHIYPLCSPTLDTNLKLTEPEAPFWPTIFMFVGARLELETLATLTAQFVVVFSDSFKPTLFAVPGEWVKPLAIT